MKKKFICISCKTENEFETDGATKLLREAVEVEPIDVYLILCKKCGKENRIQIKRESK